ncbi:MAG TPA: LuxR C-terminal-related transcriptional regulator [Acidimicrobiales bacterium]|nr:LuxR C-terminal-related transcriptional regulator [Acidimicrobiales bacterium]
MSAPVKFVVPRIPNATIVRERLLARLDEGGDAALTLVSAGPGSGKSALLAAWASTVPRTRWLSCESEHADPDQFWTDLARAVDDSDFEIVDEADPKARVRALLDALDSAGGGVVVIDDFHNAAPDPADVMTLIAGLPAGVRLVISTRADPPLPLARLRVQGRLLELRQSDLRFSPEETEAVLSTLGVSLGADELTLLDDLTEGWTAGVQLAGLSLQAHPRPVELLRTLSETNRSLVDFLMNEVIDLQPSEMREFLLASAELETFDAGLCDEVLARTDSAAMIDRARVANLFIVQVDPDGGWYRYHHLFGHFLRARLRFSDPERITALHSAAGRACAKRGDLVAAMRHHTLAGEMVPAHDLMRTYITTWMSLDDRAVSAEVVGLWLAEYGERSVEEQPAKVIECILVLSTTARVGEAHEWLRRVEARAAELEQGDLVLVHGAAAFLALRDGRLEQAAERADLAFELAVANSIEDEWLFLLAHLRIQAHTMLEDFVRADEVSDDAARLCAGIPVMSDVRLPGHRSFLAYQWGELDEAARLAERAIAGADRLGMPARNFGRADPQITLAMLVVEHRDFEAAEAALEGVMRIVEDRARPPLEMAVHLELATVEAARGNTDLVRERISLARAACRAPGPSTVALVDRIDARLALESGDIEHAAARISGLPPGPWTTLLDARLRIAAGDRDHARARLAPVAMGTRRLQIEAGLVSAVAAADDDEAIGALRGALALAEPMGYVHTIVRHGAALHDLLEQGPFAGVSAGYLACLLAAGAPTEGPAAIAQRGLVDALSDRELTVLRRLAGQEDAREIADSLYLSVNTVRSHVKSIYRKLGVSSRTDAVAEAKRLGLL